MTLIQAGPEEVQNSCDPTIILKPRRMLMRDLFAVANLVFLPLDAMHNAVRAVVQCPSLCPSHSSIVSIIGAGAIELEGARPPKFLTAGARGHNRIYGTVSMRL